MFYLAFVFGLVFGSFLNVVIYRLKSGEPIGFGRSLCPHCKTVLKWHDLMPVLSFIWLRGRCRYCNKKISWQYPMVEVLSGFIWVGVFWKVFGNWNLGFVSNFGFLASDFIYYIFIFSALLIIAIYDYKWKIIPDKIVYPAAVIALIFNLFEMFKYRNAEMFIYPLIIASIVFLFFFLIFYFSKGRAMGLGDAKLGFLVGLFLGPLPAFFAVGLAFIMGAICGIILLLIGKKSLKSQIAFGPFLAIGTIIAVFFSDLILRLVRF